MLIHYRDIDRDHPAYRGLQLLGVRGAIPTWEAKLDQTLNAGEAQRWNMLAGRPFAAAGMTRGAALECLWRLAGGDAGAARPGIGGQAAG